MTVEMENCRVLVSDQKIEQMKDILPVLEQITRQNQPLLIVTEDITGMPCSSVSSNMRCCDEFVFSHAAGTSSPCLADLFWQMDMYLFGGQGAGRGHKERAQGGGGDSVLHVSSWNCKEHVTACDIMVPCGCR